MLFIVVDMETHYFFFSQLFWYEKQHLMLQAKISLGNTLQI